MLVQFSVRLRVVPSFPPEDRRERASTKPKWWWESVLASVFAHSPTAILAFSTLVLDDLPEEGPTNRSLVYCDHVCTNLAQYNVYNTVQFSKQYIIVF